MSNPIPETEGGAGQDTMMSGLFASMVMQNTNMALIFLGQTPNPQTGQVAQELEHARYFIDQLEMLAVKTRGNLDKQEDALLKQSLTHLRLAFVEAVEHPPKAAPPPAAPATPPAEPPPAPAAGAASEVKPTAESESHKKFSKKY
jgi:hypothetical protein